MRVLFLQQTRSLSYATLRDSEEQQRHEKHPDGQYICYLPAPILKEMNIVDTPGTNVILQRQQRLTEEFVPHADLLLFVFSADKPLTESCFLRYIQQWKKKVVFVLNKSDIYRNSSELEEAILFIEENTRKLLNTDDVMLYPMSALEAKLSASSDTGKEYSELSVSESHLKITRFYELEQFLYNFLDASTTTGMERIRLTLETPIAIAERLLSACETLIQPYNYQILILLLHVYSEGGKSDTMPATSKIQNDIIGPALTDAQFLWRKLYIESFEKRWTSVDYPTSQIHLETHDLEKQVDLSTTVTENFSAGATSSYLKNKYVKWPFLGTFGGVGAAGLSASLLTSVLPTTLEDLLVLGLCTAGGFVAISTFPARRQAMVDQVNRIADGWPCTTLRIEIQNANVS
ncbi:transmembrane GTPase FZO [Salix suchowensis]|nr:transmembrane GTPase FZO [Salix suchowensis]